MHEKWLRWRSRAVLAALAGLLLMAGLAVAEGETRLVPIGAGYEEETLMLFAGQAAEHDSDGHVLIRVLPITYHFNAYDISPRLRRENLQLAGERAGQIEEACAAVAVGKTCEATVVDMMIRRDAEDPNRVAELGPEVDGFYILGGDQTVGMLVIANTPAESALAAGFAAGAAVGGNSAGAAVISRYMIGGYTGDNFAWHGLHQGAVDLWYGADDTDRRGLLFGQHQAVIDQHVLERGRTARLLQAMVEKPGDKLAVGYDWGTGGVIDGTGLARDVAGWYAAIALDGETYGAAANARYVGDDPAILEIHDVAYHVLPVGPYAYDLTSRRPVVDGAAQDAPDISGRDFAHLWGPAGAGPLFIGGDVSNDLRGEVLTAFVAAANDAGGPVIVLSAAPRSPAALGYARFWRNRLRNLGLAERPQLVALTTATDFTALGDRLAGAGAIFFTGRDQALMAELVAGMEAGGSAAALREWWRAGGVLLADNAAAAALGASMTAEPSPTSSNVEYQSSDTFLDGYLTMAPGLGLVDAVIEPRVLYDYLYGRLVSHVMADPQTVAVGLERGTGLRVTPDGVAVIGLEAAFVVDGRYAQTTAVGDNGAFAATWLLIDTFPTGTMMGE